MKALEKDRARRYDTVIGFAADIMRHLSSEPVLAAPPSRAYRMRKFGPQAPRRGDCRQLGPLAALVAGIVGTSSGSVPGGAGQRITREEERRTGHGQRRPDPIPGGRARARTTSPSRPSRRSTPA